MDDSRVVVCRCGLYLLALNPEGDLAQSFQCKAAIREIKGVLPATTK